MLIEENKLYTKEELETELGFAETTAKKIFNEAKVYKYPKRFLLLGKNLIKYIDEQSTDKPK